MKMIQNFDFDYEFRKAGRVISSWSKIKKLRIKLAFLRREK